MLGIFLSFCVAFLASFGQVAGKFATKKSDFSQSDEYNLSFGIRLFSSILLFPALFFVPFPEISFSILMLLFSVVILSTISTVTSLKAVKYGEISIVGPIGALALPLLLFTSYIFTGELPNTAGYIGVLIIFLGLYSLEGGIKNGIFNPFISMFSDVGARAMLITTLIQSITAPLDKIGIGKFGIFAWLFWTSVLSLPLLWFYMKYIGKHLEWKKYIEKKHMQKVGILSILMGGGLVLQMLALKYTLVVYVISIKRTSGMISVLLGALFFKEKNILKKFIASAIMFLGIIVIVVFGNI